MRVGRTPPSIININSNSNSQTTQHVSKITTHLADPNQGEQRGQRAGAMYVLPIVVTIFVPVAASGTANLPFEPITRLKYFFAWREGPLTIQLVLYPGRSPEGVNLKIIPITSRSHHDRYRSVPIGTDPSRSCHFYPDHIPIISRLNLA